MADRPSYEEARKIIIPGEPPPDATPVGGTRFDKDAPKGPPEPEVRRVPEWFEDVLKWLQGTVNDEGLILDLCLERAIQIVEFNHNRGMAGIDYFPEANGNGGISASRIQFTAIAAPLAAELYKQVLAAVMKNNAEFTRLVEAALQKKAALEPKA